MAERTFPPASIANGRGNPAREKAGHAHVVATPYCPVLLTGQAAPSATLSPKASKNTKRPGQDDLGVLTAPEAWSRTRTSESQSRLLRENVSVIFHRAQDRFFFGAISPVPWAGWLGRATLWQGKDTSRTGKTTTGYTCTRQYVLSRMTFCCYRPA